MSLDILKINLNGEKKLKPSIDALLGIQEDLGLSIGEILQRFSEPMTNSRGEILVNDNGEVQYKPLDLNLMLATLYHGLKAGGNEVSMDEIKEFLSTEGLYIFTEAVASFFPVGIAGEKAATVALVPLSTKNSDNE